MSHGEEENQGTGLRDVLGILIKTPKERLLSLTFQLDESPEENIVHALCLILLRREERALNRLQMLKDNAIAAHLAEKWQTSGGNIEDFSAQLTGECSQPLARIYKVLTEQRLCDPSLRNLAYKRALSSDAQKTSHDEHLQYDQLREEANVVCGPQFAEGMCSSKDLKSEPYRDPLSSPDQGNTTLNVSLSQGQSEVACSLPSPLQTTSSLPSYPTHLEISIPATASFQDNQISPEASEESKPKNPVLPVSGCEVKDVVGRSCTSEPKSSEPPLIGAKKHPSMDEALAEEGGKLNLHQTTKPTTKPNFATPLATDIFLPKIPNDTHVSKEAEEEEEATFYTFVILHAPEDEDVAESMRERVEGVINSEGATFSADFEIPGRSKLRCVEDAINNSAFTLLLLTRNFNTRMLELETDSALINSINKTHKYNTVIPLLPRENCMPIMSLPIVLQTINALEENKSFERKILKVFSPAKIRNMRGIWQKEQEVKRTMKKQERLKNSNCLIEQQGVLIGHGGHWQQPTNIHIQNSSYIVIGNDSHLNVDFSGGAEKDDSEEE